MWSIVSYAARKRQRLFCCIVLGAALFTLLCFFYPADIERHPKIERNVVQVHNERYSHVDRVHDHVLNTSKLQATTGLTRRSWKVHRNTVPSSTHTQPPETKAGHRQHVQSALDRVLGRVKTCLEATNMADEANEQIALTNAQEFYNEYRKVIPSSFASNYSSHCWKMNFDAKVHYSYMYKGHLGKHEFRGSMFSWDEAMRNTINNAYNGSFSSDVVCLPKVFLAGFPKCGSTYAFCFLQSLIHLSTGLRMAARTEMMKEPHFWVRVRVSKHVQWPKPADLGEYLVNFIPAISKINTFKNKEVVLVDGTPNMLFDSPRFDAKHSNCSNYCLLPSALPELLPKSKFIIITRNPLKMLYSAFWFSCFTKGIKVPRETQLLGPTLFHDRIKAKMNLFNDCMRDPDNPDISEPCTLLDGSDFGSCITKRLHLLDKCVRKITFNLFSKELPECGRSRVEMGLFYTHIRKLLTVVPREKVLVLTLEQLMKEPKVIARQILTFLEYPVLDSVIDQVQLITLTCTKNSQDLIPYKTDPKLKMKEETREMILKFFKPFNSLLADLLQDNRFLWDD